MHPLGRTLSRRKKPYKNILAGHEKFYVIEGGMSGENKSHESGGGGE